MRYPVPFRRAALSGGHWPGAGDRRDGLAAAGTAWQGSGRPGSSDRLSPSGDGRHASR